MKWTDDQKLAIKSRGGKIIVSAAAGSGKQRFYQPELLII